MMDSEDGQGGVDGPVLERDLLSSRLYGGSEAVPALCRLGGRSTPGAWKVASGYWLTARLRDTMRSRNATSWLATWSTLRRPASWVVNLMPAAWRPLPA